MSNDTGSNDFKLVVLAIIAVIVIVGGICFAMYKTTEIKKAAEVKKIELVQEAKNERNKERWASLPFLRNKKEEK